MLPFVPSNDLPPNVDGIPEQVLVEAGYHSPSPMLPPAPPPLPYIQPIKMSPLTEARFMDAFMLFSNATGIKLNERDFFIEGHQVNPWELYRTVSLRNGFDSVTMNGEWPMVGVDLGFPSVSCGDPHPLAHCTPAVAHQLHQLYQNTLRHFDQAYTRGIINQLEYLHTTGQRPSQSQQLPAQRPTEADYLALLAIAPTKSSVLTSEAMNILPRFCDVSTAELEAYRVPQHVVAYVEQHREYLKWLAQDPRFRDSFTPNERPQLVHQNLLNGVRPPNYQQLQQQRADWGILHGNAVNLSLPQQQIISALRAQVQQGNITHQQALDRLATIQASSAHSFQERSVAQQFPLSTGFNAGGVPGGNAHQQMDTLSQHTRTIQAQDTSHINTLICQGPQLQNDPGLTSRTTQNLSPFRMDLPQGSRGPGLQNFPSVHHASGQSSSPPPASQPPPGPGPARTIGDVPLPQLRALYTQLMHVVVEGEKNLQATSSWGEGDIQRQQLRAKVELNKQRLRALTEVINVKMRESGGLAQQAVNGPRQLMSTPGVPYTGAQIVTGSISSAGAHNHAAPVSMNSAAMSGNRSTSIFTQSPGALQIRHLAQEDLIAAKRFVDEKKRIAFSSDIYGIVSFPPIPESDVQEYHRNLDRLDQVLANIEKYVHLAFAALPKGEVVERLFKMMASAKYQLEELKKPNPRYVLELHTIRGMIQEADNMDKGLKSILHRVQAQMIPMPHDGVSSSFAPQPPPQLHSIPVLSPILPVKREPEQGDDLESVRSSEGAMSHREGQFDEEVRIAMSKLEI